MVGNITIVQPGQTRERHIRRPNFPIAGTLKPFGLYPIMCHPVLPGETLKSASSKWSVVSAPILNPLAGAWLETWMFYIKLTDIDRELGNMFIADDFSTSGYTTTSDDFSHFRANGQINWIALCVARVVEAFFTNADETVPFLGSPDGAIRMAKINQRSWYQNMMFEPAEVAVDVTGERDHMEQMSAWQMAQQMSMTELTYEQYLQQYGVSSQNIGIGEPEILRYSRSWTKPTNTIDPTDGAPASAWVWNDEMKIDKDKRFSEPGFIMMMATVRPKMYQTGMVASMVGNLWGFTDWYPAYNLENPAAGMRRIGTDDLVFKGDLNAAEGEVQLIYDHRDLLSHGEQFVNNDGTDMPHRLPTSTGWSTVAAASKENVRGEYVTTSDINSLFVTTGTSKTTRCLYEGIVGLTIAGHVQDTTR